MEIVEVSALILGLTQIFKGFIPESWRDRVMPVIAVLLGVFANCYIVGDYASMTVTNGLVYGLMVTGLYKIPKNA